MSFASGKAGGQAEIPQRFVVQRHETAEGGHWDLMIETDEALWTWRVNAGPEAFGHGPLRLVRIFDHRKDSLAYEGPLSGGRGSVRIAERGTYRPLVWTEDHLRLELRGRKLRGRFELRRVTPTGDDWLLEAETGA